MTKDKDLPSNLAELLKKYSFSSPISLFENEYQYQTLGGFDAIYIPSRTSNEDKLSPLKKVEEQFHLEQLRNSIAGASLEILARRCAIGVKQYLHKDSELSEQALLLTLESQYTQYFSYFESLRTPLEVQTMFTYIISSLLAPRISKSEIEFFPEFEDPTTPSTSERNPVVLDEEESKNLEQTSLEYIVSRGREDSKILDPSEPPVENIDLDELLKLAHYFDYSEWLEESIDILKQTITKRPKLPPQAIRYLYIPSWYALNPPQVPTITPYGQLDKKSPSYDPKERFYRVIEVLNEVPQSELMRHFEKRNPIKFLVDYLERKGIEPMSPKPYLNSWREKTSKQMAESYPHLPEIEKISVLIPLRASSKELQLSPIDSEFSSGDLSPSITITPQRGLDEREFKIEITNDDTVSRQLFKEVRLFQQGLEIQDSRFSSEAKQSLKEVPLMTTREMCVLLIYGISSKVLPLSRQKELVGALNVPNWPLEEEQLAKKYKVPEKVVKRYNKWGEEGGPTGIGLLAVGLGDLVGGIQEEREDIEAFKAFTSSFPKVLSAFQDIDSCAEIVIKEGAELWDLFMDTLKSDSFKKTVKKQLSNTSYGWEDLLSDLKNLYEAKNK